VYSPSLFVSTWWVSSTLFSSIIVTVNTFWANGRFSPSSSTPWIVCVSCTYTGLVSSIVRVTVSGIIVMFVMFCVTLLAFTPLLGRYVPFPRYSTSKLNPSSPDGTSSTSPRKNVKLLLPFNCNSLVVPLTITRTIPSVTVFPSSPFTTTSILANLAVLFKTATLVVVGIFVMS